MPAARAVPPDHPAFTALPVRQITVGDARETMAVHVAGQLTIGRMPVICVPGYQRNMSDYTDFVGLFHRTMGEDWPIILVDLKGRGRSADRIDKKNYITPVDAGDLAQICAAFAVESAIFVGQGYGGQVLIALGAARPTLVGGVVLIDSGPVSDPRGLVRLRNNLRDLEGNRSPAGLRSMFRRMLSADYPGVPEVLLDTLATRTHYLDKRNRVRTLFDPHLITMLDSYEHDDVLMAQWPLFAAIGAMPLMLMRTQLTDQLRREVFEEMMKRRRDSDGYIIEGQASPALLNSVEDAEPIADFARQVVKRKSRPAGAEREKLSA